MGIIIIIIIIGTETKIMGTGEGMRIRRRHPPPSTPTLHPSQVINSLSPIRETDRREYSRPYNSH
jgi:hypothetical protein